MNFKLDDDSLGKIIDIFDHIAEILKIDLYHYLYDDNNGITYFKTKVSDDTDFRKNKNKTINTIPNKRTKYTIVEYYYKYNLFTIIIKIQLKKQIIILKYFLQQCRYTSFMIFLILQILSQRVNLKKKSLMRILNKDLKIYTLIT